MLIAAESYKHALIAHDKYKGNNGKSAALGLYKNGNGAIGNASRLTGQAIVDDLTVLANGDTPYSVFFNNAVVNIGERDVDDTQNGTFSRGNACLAVTLERSDLFNLSGVPINNSRVLAIRADYTTAGAAMEKTVTSFLKYVRLARVFLNNVEVEQ